MRAAGSAGHWDCFWLLVAVMAVLGGVSVHRDQKQLGRISQQALVGSKMDNQLAALVGSGELFAGAWWRFLWAWQSWGHSQSTEKCHFLCTRAAAHLVLSFA